MPEEPILFVSDLHLSPERPTLVTRFREFLQGPAREAGTLYILGDLFDYWVHDGQARDPGYAAVLGALRELAAAGVALRLFGGNRDFPMGKAFAAATGAVLLPDPHPIRLGDLHAILTHGDLLCTDDRAYQRFRRVIRHPLVRHTVGSLPYPVLRWLGERLRHESQKAVTRKAYPIMDVNAEAVCNALQGKGTFASPLAPYDIIIHGHTHRPAVHHLESGGRPVRRLVLGAWDGNGGYYAAYVEGDVSLLSFP